MIRSLPEARGGLASRQRRVAYYARMLSLR